MLSTLFHIPTRLTFGDWSLPLFGWGLGLAVWAVASAVLVARSLRLRGWRDTAAALALPLAITGGLVGFILPLLDDGRGIPVRGYGVMLLAAATAGTWLSIWRGRALGFDADTIVGLAFEVFLWGLVGARLFYVLEYREQFFPPGRSLVAALPDVLNLAAGGLVVFGSLPTAALAAWRYAARRGLPILSLADCIAPGMLVGLALGRLGCLLNGCCYGGPCDLPWALQFPAQSPPWLDQVARGLVPAGAAWSLPVHPAQLYAALDAALLAVVAMAFTPLARRPGAVFALVLTLHPISRLLLEAIRIDEPPVFGTGLSISQVVSVVLLALAVALWWWLSRQPVGPVHSGQALPPQPPAPPARGVRP